MAELLVDGNTPRNIDEDQFRLRQWLDLAPFEDYVGLVLDTAADGEARLSVPFRLCLANGGGVMHGGALVTLADTAVAMAIKTKLPTGTVFATTELRTEFFAPVRSGMVTASARVRGPEGRSFYGDVEVYDETGALVARFSSIFRVARGQGLEDLPGG